MLREVSLRQALDMLEGGEDVKCLVPGADPDEWTDYNVMHLKDLIAGVICLYGVNDVPTEKTPPADPPMKKEGKKRLLDTGKIKALHNAGWSVQKIADEMGVSWPTINKYIQETKEEK